MSDDIEEVRGAKVTIRFEAKKCIHSRGCVLGLAGLRLAGRGEAGARVGPSQ